MTTSKPVSRTCACRLPIAAQPGMTNLIERLFGEERRRLKIVPNAFGEKPVLKLMFGALIRAAESWRGLRFTEFELRQLDAVRFDPLTDAIEFGRELIPRIKARGIEIDSVKAAE